MNGRALGRISLMLLLVGGCSRSPEPSRAPIPADLQIFVELDGQALPTLDAHTLSVAPDIEEEHRIGWNLERLVPQLAQASQLVVEKEDHQRVVLPLGQAGEPRSEIVLLLNRKGEVVLASVDPDDPFPAFHGRGGNRGRSPGGERIRDPQWLRLRSRSPERPEGRRDAS